MASHDNQPDNNETVQKTILILVAVSLNILELFIPRIPLFPWLKPGLANCITIIWIIRYGTIDALLFTFVRVWISSFYFGLSLVTISLALSGGILSTVTMGILWHLFGNRTYIRTGTIGLAIAGALLHNIGQLVAVYLLLARNSAIIYQLPAMGVASLLFGCITGIVTPALWRVLFVNNQSSTTLQPEATLSNNTISRKNISFIGVCALGAAALVTVRSPLYLGIITVAVSLLAIAVSHLHARAVIYPIRFWFLFLFIAFFNIFFSYGTRIPSLPFVTHEGLREAFLHALRLWSWIEISLLLQALHANTLFFKSLKRVFPKRSDSLAAGLLALEFFPEIISFVKSSDGRKGLPWHKPAVALPQFVARIQTFITSQIDAANRGRYRNSG